MTNKSEQITITLAEALTENILSEDRLLELIAMCINDYKTDIVEYTRTNPEDSDTTQEMYANFYNQLSKVTDIIDEHPAISPEFASKYVDLVGLWYKADTAAPLSKGFLRFKVVHQAYDQFMEIIKSHREETKNQEAIQCTLC